jgi:hypothetical protein
MVSMTFPVDHEDDLANLRCIRSGSLREGENPAAKSALR